jgi:thioredoxin reductase
MDIEGVLRLRPGSLCETAVNGIFACGHLLAPAADIATVINSARNASAEIGKFLEV